MPMNEVVIFRDRRDAGQRLAARLEKYRGPDTVVLAIPRGGVVVAYEVARLLGAPLDVVIPRKIGAPGQPELAIGAIGDNISVLDQHMIDYLGVSEQYIREEIERQRHEIERRSRLYRGGQPPLAIEGRTVILVDDGMATGSTTLVAVRSLRRRNPARLVLAVPVASHEAVARLRPEVDDLIVLETPDYFMSVGSWYQEFEQTTDEEVIDLLRRAEVPSGAQPPA